jgi:endonuclease YncB( thermonuclease family)
MAAKPLPAIFYQYNATVQYVIDGDTLAVDVDLGFFCWVRMSCRINGIDAPEKDTTAGQASKAFLTKYLPPGTALIVDSVKTDKYGGRFDAKVWKVENGENVGEQLVKGGHAQAWNMRTQAKPYALKK